MMNELWEYPVKILWVILCLCLIFLFEGKPNVYDRLHSMAMGDYTEEGAKND